MICPKGEPFGLVGGNRRGRSSRNPRSGPCIRKGTQSSRCIRKGTRSSRCGCTETPIRPVRLHRNPIKQVHPQRNPIKPVRLHRNHQKGSAATMRRNASASAEIQAFRSIRSRPAYAAASPTTKGQEGVRGESRFAFPPPAGFPPLPPRETTSLHHEGATLYPAEPPALPNPAGRKAWLAGTSSDLAALGHLPQRGRLSWWAMFALICSYLR